MKTKMRVVSAVAAFLSFNTWAEATMRATNLRCEYLAAPLGIDRAAPRLSWIVEADRPDEFQRAYRVLVATSDATLAKDVGDLWDSSRVASGDTTAIVYDGKPLASGQRVWWKVQASDRDGTAGPWSAPQSWSMGLLAASDWQAKWIGYDAGRDALARVPGPLDDAKWIVSANDPRPAPALNRWFRRSVTLPADVKVAKAEFVISADDRFAAEVNGTFVGRGGDWKVPTTIDVRNALRAGENALMIQVTNDAPSPTGLIASLRVIDDAGREVRVVSDSHWSASETLDGARSPAREVGAYGVGPWGKIGAALVLPPAAYLRRDFTLAKPVRRATLYSATLGVADVYLNGRRVTDDYFTSGWTDYAIRSYYRAYDVTDRLRAGDNAIGAIVADGWFSGYYAFKQRRDWYGTQPRLRTQLDVEFDDGTHQIVASDDSWRATNGAVVEADLLAGERYDARREMPGWNAAGFDDAAWKAVDVSTKDSPVMQAHPAQPVRVIHEWPAKKVTEPTPGKYVVDFGQNTAGVVRLRVKGKPGQAITIRHAERLNDDGTIYTTNLRHARATDVYICKGGDAVEEWTPRFTFHGFQYIEVSGLDSPPTSDTVALRSMTSDAPVVGTFESSDKMLNQLHSNIYQTQAMNFIDIPTDCPQRDERLGWTGDAQVYIRTAALNVDVQRFFDKWLVDLADQQRADGQFPTVAPLAEAGGDDGGPAWSDAGVICPWAIYDVYGDRVVLERQYPSMQKFMDFMVRRSTPDLLPPKEFHAFGDWLSINAETPKDLIYVAYFAHDADLMQRTATVLGRTEDAKRYGELFERLKTSFRKAFVAADGTIKGDTQCGYVLAIAFDLLDEAATKEAGRRLVADIEAKGNHLSTGFIGTKDLMLALDKIGRNDVAYRLLFQDTFPSWGFSIRHGATSIWERWNGWTPEQGFGDPGMNSFAHYSFGAVYQWMAESIGGIRNGGDAYRRIVIQPTLDSKLTFAKTSYASIRGAIATDWKRDGDRVTLKVTIPANTTATVRLPTGSPDDVRVDGVKAAGTRLVKGRVEVDIGSGVRTFQFAVR